MCGRYFFKLEENIPEFAKLRRKLYDHDLFGFQEGEIFPTQNVLVLVADGPNDYRPVIMKWGIQGPRSNLLINARSERIYEKYIFRPMLQHRCAVVANGFYEWIKQGKTKDKIYIQKEDASLIYFAGIYNEMGEFVIITGASMNEMLTVHDRTPFIMNESHMMAYLYKDEDFYVDNENLMFQKM